MIPRLSEGRVQTDERTSFGGKETAMVVLSFAAVLGFFVGWILYSSSIRDEKKIAGLLTPAEMEKLQREAVQLRADGETVEREIAALIREVSNLEEGIEQREASIADLRKNIEGIKGQRLTLTSYLISIGVKPEDITVIARSAGAPK